MLNEVMRAVEEFHKHVNVSTKCEMGEDYILGDAELEVLHHMTEVSNLLENLTSDPRYLRMHLILEECAETLNSMLCGDKTETLDGLTDLIYVAVGTAVQFGWDIDEAMKRVHHSNMTKKPSGPRCRDKGNEFTPVQLKDLV